MRASTFPGFAILRHRLIPCGAELATPQSGLSRNLLIKGGWRQGVEFLYRRNLSEAQSWQLGSPVRKVWFVSNLVFQLVSLKVLKNHWLAFLVLLTD